jgi:hypothetical protein
MKENDGFSRRKYKQLTQVGLPLESMLKAIRKTNVLLIAKIIDDWENIVGQRLSKVSAPQSLSKRTLKIGVSQPVWVDSMLYHKADILKKINDLFASPIADDIRIAFQPNFSSLKENNSLKKPHSNTSYQELKLTKSEIYAIEKMTSGVTDLQLRSTIKRVILKDYLAKKKRPSE